MDRLALRLLAVAMCLAVAGCAPGPVQRPQPAVAVPIEITEAVVELEIRRNDRIGGCTATFVASDLLATAAHCVEDASPDRLRYHSSDGATHKVLEVVEVGGLFPGDWVDADRGGEDWAVLRVEPTSRKPIAVAPLQPGELDALANAQTPVHLYSYSGDARRLHALAPCTLFARQFDGFYAMKCEVRSGDSGAPVLLMTSNGSRLIAVLSGHNEHAAFSISAAQFAPLIHP